MPSEKNSPCHTIGMVLIVLSMFLAVGLVGDTLNSPAIVMAADVLTVAGLLVIFVGVPALMAIVRNTHRSAELLDQIQAKAEARPDALERVQ